MKNKGTNQFDFINLFQFSFPICQIQVNGLLLSIKRSCHQSLLIGRQVFQSKKWEEQSIRNLQNKRAMNSSKSQSIIHFFTLQESCHQSCAQIFFIKSAGCSYKPSCPSVALTNDNYPQYLQYLLSNHIYLCKSAMCTASFRHSLHRRTMIEPGDDILPIFTGVKGSYFQF